MPGSFFTKDRAFMLLPFFLKVSLFFFSFFFFEGVGVEHLIGPTCFSIPFCDSNSLGSDPLARLVPVSLCSIAPQSSAPPQRHFDFIASSSLYERVPLDFDAFVLTSFPFLLSYKS